MSEIWEIIQGNFVVVLMVLARVSGIFTFNPIFSRNGVPNMVKVGLSLMLAVVMAAAGDFSYSMPQGLLPFLFDIGKELLVGAVLGFYVNILLQVFSAAGELADFQIGLSMAKGYDPTFGTSSLITKYYSYWFMIYFFAVGGHLSYIELFATSYEGIPMGFGNFNISVLYILVKYFETVLTLGVKLAMPIVAAELVTEFCIGVLMKAVPSIHVFVMNVQIKMLVGFVVLAGSCSMISGFIDDLMDLLFTNLNGLIGQMVLPL
ncbi:MAG: flagellar biosynthetic protein FliR [Oscillospiraceae bacterium]